MKALTVEATTAPALPEHKQAQAEMQRRNNEAEAKQGEVERVQRVLRGDDPIARREAELELPTLLRDLKRCEIIADKARATYDAALARWRQERELYYEPLFKSAIKKHDEALAAAERSNEALCSVIERARQDGVTLDGGVAWPEFGRETGSVTTRYASWRAYCRRNKLMP